MLFVFLVGSLDVAVSIYTETDKKDVATLIFIINIGHASYAFMFNKSVKEEQRKGQGKEDH